ncbi:hypothetical protein ACTXT7_000642 [Hymenolepis weldensis]
MTIVGGHLEQMSIEEMMGGYVWADLLLYTRMKFPATVMVLGVASSERGAHHDFSIFSQGLRVNPDAYVEILQTIADKAP